MLSSGLPHQLGSTGITFATLPIVTMADVYYEERTDRAVLQSDSDGEWLSADAIVALDDWV